MAELTRRRLSASLPKATISQTPVPGVSRWPGAWSTLTLDVAVARTVVLLVAAVHLAVAWFARIPGIGWGEDDAQYFNLARDLASFGYHERWDVAAPFHVRYPPLFPALLAVIGIPSRWNVDVMLFAVSLCSALAIVVFFDAARRVVGTELALLASILWAFNPLTVRFGGWLLSEPLFNLLFAIALWGIAREEEGTRYGVLAGAALSAAALTRTAGVALICGLMAWWLFKRRWRRAAVLAVVSGGTIGVWLVYSFLSPESESQRLYSADLAKIVSAAPQRAPVAPGQRDGGGAPPASLDPGARVTTRLERIFVNAVPTVLAFRTIQGTIVDNVAWLILMLATGVVGALMMLRMWPGAALSLSAYLLLLSLWTWLMERYFSPIIPLMYLAMLMGASWWFTRVAPRWRAVGLLGFVALLLLGELPQVANLPVERARCDRAHVITSERCYPPDERTYLAVAQWVRDSTPSDAVFLASKEAAFYTHSGRRVVNQIRALREDSTSIIPFLRNSGVRYVVVGSVGVRAIRHGKLMASACRDLVLVREFPRDYVVLRVRAADEPSDGGAACRALATWRDRRPAPERRRGVRAVWTPPAPDDSASAS